MEFIRNCPACDKKITYVSQYKLNAAIKRNNNCRSCATPNMKGKNNPMYGKKHTEEWKSNHGKSHTEEFKKYLSEKFKGQHHSPNTEFKKGYVNPTPHSFYQIWIEKYGLEEADRKKADWSQKKSLTMLGEKNHRYGKPPAQGVGHGWSGWYKGWFFRSLLELSYMVKVIEKEGLVWESGEQKQLRIQYTDYNGVSKNYFTDFLIDGNRLIEIKPKALHNSVVVLLKKEAAEKFCLARGWVYELVTPKMLSDKEILVLYTQKDLKFMDKYNDKYNEKFKEKIA